jgi:hypothetical protein
MPLKAFEVNFGIEDLQGHSMASFRASTQESTSKVMASRHERTTRVTQSM